MEHSTAGTVGVLYTDSLCLAGRGAASSTVGASRVSNALLDQVARPSLPGHRQQAGHFCHGQSLGKAHVLLAERAGHAAPLCSLQSTNQAHSDQGQLESSWKLVSLFSAVQRCYAESTAQKLAIIFNSSLWWHSQYAFSSQFFTYFKIFSLDLGQKWHKLFIIYLKLILRDRSFWASTLIFLLAYWMKFFYFSFDTNIWKGLKSKRHPHADVLIVGLCAGLRPIRKFDSKTHLEKLIDFLF